MIKTLVPIALCILLAFCCAFQIAQATRILDEAGGGGSGAFKKWSDWESSVNRSKVLLSSKKNKGVVEEAMGQQSANKDSDTEANENEKEFGRESIQKLEFHLHNKYAEYNRITMINRILSYYIFWGLLLTFVCLPRVTVMIFQAFRCVDIDADNVRPDGTPNWFLRADMTISCTSPRYYLGRDFAMFMLFVYPIGIPLVYFILLFTNRHAIRTHDTDSHHQSQSFFHSPLSLISKLKKSSKEQQQNHKRPSVIASLFGGGHNSNSPGVVRVSHNEIGFLWRSYRPERWFWELIETARRLFFTAFLSVVLPGSNQQCIFGLIAAIFAIYIYSHAKPHPNVHDQTLLELGNYQILLTLVGANIIRTKSLVSSNEETYHNIYVEVGLILVNVSTIFLAAHFLLKEISHWYMQLTVYIWNLFYHRLRSALFLASSSKKKEEKKPFAANVVSPLFAQYGDQAMSARHEKSKSIAPFSSSFKSSQCEEKTKELESLTSSSNSSFQFVTVNPSFAKRESASAGPLKKQDFSSSSSSSSSNSSSSSSSPISSKEVVGGDVNVQSLLLELAELKQRLEKETSEKEFVLQKLARQQQQQSRGEADIQ